VSDDPVSDDSFHPPDSDEPHWTETCWFTFAVPERRLSGTFYPLFRPNLGVCSAAVYVWDDTAHELQDICYGRNLWHLPFPAGDLTDLSLPGGLRYRCLEPATRFAISYAHGEEIAVDLRFDAVAPPHYLGAAHLDQPGRVHGDLTLHGERIPVDCFAVRDRTWSNRSDFHDTLMGAATSGTYVHGMVDANDGFQALGATRDDTCAIVAGYLIRDGVLADVVGGTRRVVARDEGRPTHVILELTDKLGRTISAEGRTHNAFAWQFTPNMFSWICLTEWTWEAGRGWGEDHDNWSAAGWRAFRRGGM
jgi:hypothetical protein